MLLNVINVYVIDTVSWRGSHVVIQLHPEQFQTQPDGVTASQRSNWRQVRFLTFWKVNMVEMWEFHLTQTVSYEYVCVCVCVFCTIMSMWSLFLSICASLQEQTLVYCMCIFQWSSVCHLYFFSSNIMLFITFAQIFYCLTLLDIK